ncbi:hypothetical protein KQX54_004423 [Cotesia glomerata]|uniref:Uncharacterized protein n=1 Tax=Cotesia glomerata TaxID=32391 RepID=A0AAV7IQK1_COTGL|nr:hypothetical protein KQX54_004423 [Cotesia glomerata]
MNFYTKILSIVASILILANPLEGQCEKKPIIEELTTFIVSSLKYYDDYDYDCRETANSVRNYGRQCICQSGYFKQGDKCVPRLNSPCKYSKDCGETNWECVSEKCKCNQCSYEYHDRCLPYASSIPECFGRPSCPGEQCNYSKCRCDTGYVVNNGSCVGELESRCTSSLKCYDKIMICVLGKCQCAPGYFRWFNAYCLENHGRK